MSDALLATVLGTGGLAFASLAAIAIVRARTNSKGGRVPRLAAAHTPRSNEGSATDLRELRILRALFGEPNGRFLFAYKDKYYQRSLNATVKKGLVTVIDGRYHLTAKGADFCRAYFQELLGDWQPTAGAFTGQPLD